MGLVGKIRRWLGSARRDEAAKADGLEPVALPPAGSLGEREKETSTNAQAQGARDEPWPGG